jgi:hypothetical protein
VPDDEGVARDVTRDPVPVGDRLDILRTHPKLLLNGLVAENPHYLSPDDHIAARLGRNERRRGLGDVDRRIAVRPRRAHERRACRPGLPCPAHPRDRYLHAIPRSRLSDLVHVLAAQVPVGTWHDAETSLNQRSGEVGSVRSGRTTALLRRVLRQITSDGAGSPESIIDAGEQLGLVMDEAA